MVNAISGVEPFAIWCLKEVRTTALGAPLPYPTSPLNLSVSEEKIDFSTTKPVLISETEPNPCEGEPATKESEPFKSG